MLSIHVCHQKYSWLGNCLVVLTCITREPPIYSAIPRAPVLPISAPADRRSMKRLIFGGVGMGRVRGVGVRAKNRKPPAAAPAKAAAAAAAAPTAVNPRDWPAVGNDPGGMKFS